MASFIKSARVLQKLSATNPALLRQTARYMAGWNKDYKPGPYPKTQEERDAAAKKYFMLPEEYKPFADNGLGYGDYPDIAPGLGDEAKDPYYPYDYPELKHNFNETFNVDANIYGEDRYSQPAPPRFPNKNYFLSFLGVMAACFATFYFLQDYKMYRSAAVKQLPGDGRKHYTFEME